MYSIRNAQMEDLPRLEDIYAYARSFMERTGNPNQWGTKNPPTAQLREDICRQELYVLEDKVGIHGVFYFAMGDDPTYAEIFDGSWVSNAPYGTIHRIASDGSGGIFTAALEFCKSISSHIRIDTHHDNQVMQHVVEKHGFSRRGIIYIADGSPRIAYEFLEKNP